MLVVTTETISGKNLEMLGLVAGNTVRSKNLVKDFGAGMKSLPSVYILASGQTIPVSQKS